MVENHERLRGVFEEFVEIAPEGTVVYDRELKQIAYVSPVAREMTGLTSGDGSEAVRSALERVAIQDRPYLKDHWNRVERGEKTTEVEIQIFGQNDRAYYLCLSAYALNDGLFTLVRLKDIGEAKEHENYLLEFGAKKNTTLDSVVHFISGSVSLTQHLSFKATRSVESQNQEDLAVYLGLINENSDQCLKVVDDLLREEHLKAPEIAVKKSRSNINEKVSFIVERLRKAYPARNIRFTCSRETIFVPLDELKVSQIVNNMLSNALKFTPEGEMIAVHIDDLESSVLISVSDNGIGIPEALQPFVFDRNGSAKRNGLRGERSNGIGMFICDVLARLMNGRIWFESNKSRGTTFYLSLPKAE